MENRPYTDLRQFHFGVLVGGHVQDLELLNVGQQTITKEDGTQSSVLISADQDRYDAGFHVGVLGEIRLTEHLQLRVAPAMYFGSRHITFHNFNEQDTDGKTSSAVKNSLCFNCLRYNICSSTIQQSSSLFDAWSESNAKPQQQKQRLSALKEIRHLYGDWCWLRFLSSIL